MKILGVTDYQINNSTTFGVNLNSKKLQFCEDDFYVRIRGYGRNPNWAKKIKETADNAVKYIRAKCNIEETLKRITAGITEANQLPIDLDKRQHSGILRTKREGWRSGSDWDNCGIITRYGKDKNNKYNSYYDKFEYVFLHPLNNPYSDISLTRPRHDAHYLGKYLDHADSKYINNAFGHIEKIYNDLYSKYILQEAKKEDLPEINSSIAEMRWILAHTTPWERGSDAISNTFIRALYKSMGIKTSRLEKGISLDLEAYCTNLNDYKKNFADYFSRKPYLVE